MEEKKAFKKKKRKKGIRTAVLLAAVLAAGLGGFFFWKQKQAVKASDTADKVQTAKAAVMDITSELTASSSLSPKDTYEVTSLVERAKYWRPCLKRGMWWKRIRFYTGSTLPPWIRT